MRAWIALLFVVAALAGCLDTGDQTTSPTANDGTNAPQTGDFAAPNVDQIPPPVGSSAARVMDYDIAFEPHVIVGIPDSGINPYHEMYYREDRTQHPCTYIADFPCTVRELPLSVGVYDSWDEAFEADQELWDALEANTWYWIPQTVFVAVSSEGCDGVCILDDTSMHGTGTTSSALTENPDALIAFKEGGSSIVPFTEAGIPVDVFSVSWGFIAPIPTPGPACLEADSEVYGLYIKASGNQPGVSTLLDCWSGKPQLISVGGAYAEDQSQEPLAYKEMDVVSYYCRPTAQTNSITEIRESYCGTSFSAPTVAGALSKVILTIRQQTGYLGSIEGDVLDPEFGLTIGMLRESLNMTATYEPESQYPNAGGLPLNPVAPWLQWGWGFYDGLVSDRTLDMLVNGTAYTKPDEAVLHQETIYTLRETIY